MKIGRYRFDISHEGKILFPRTKISKSELIDYYTMIAPMMIPHMKDRPISMQRFPEGINHEGFYQKDAGKYFPDWITTIDVKKQMGGSVHYVVVDKPATLIYLANQGCITFHLWLSRIDKLNYPDRMIFDLDPSGKSTFASVRWAAWQLKSALEEHNITPWVMLTGSRGVHVVVALKRNYTFDQVRAFAQKIAQELVQQHPNKLTLEIRKNKRGDKIFIDTLRNAFGQTGVAPYSVRAKEKAPVATPIEWDELDKVKPDQFTILSIKKRLDQMGDPWQQITKHAVHLK